LNGNKIEWIEANTFDTLINLNYLNIGDNNLKLLVDGLFSKLEGLEVLDLSLNKIGILNKNTFTGLHNLNILDLEQNELKSIDKNAFAMLVSLIDLNLAENKLQIIEPGTFSSLVKLDDLNLSNNKIKLLNNNTFKNLASNLKSLNLSDNQLDVTLLMAPGNELFSCLVNLENLKLVRPTDPFALTTKPTTTNGDGNCANAVRVLMFIFLKVSDYESESFSNGINS